MAQATTDADCVISIISETPFITWNTAWAQSGTDAQQYGPQGNLNEISAAGNEEATNGNIIAGMYPDISTEPWAEYRTALEEAGLDTEALDYNSLGGMGTWAAYVGFTQIAETIDGDITAESFYEAANTTSALDLNGMVPVLDSPRNGPMAWRATSDCSTEAWFQPAGGRRGRPADDGVRGRERPRHWPGPGLIDPGRPADATGRERS